MNRRQVQHPDPFRNSAASPGPGPGHMGWNASRSPVYLDPRRNSPPERTFSQPSGVALSTPAAYNVPIGTNGHGHGHNHGPPPRVETSFPMPMPLPMSSAARPSSRPYSPIRQHSHQQHTHQQPPPPPPPIGYEYSMPPQASTPVPPPGYGPLSNGVPTSSPSAVWNSQSAMYSPTDSVDDIIASNMDLSDCSLDNDNGGGSGSPPSGPRYRGARGGGVDINGTGGGGGAGTSIRPAQRRPSNRDEFDGPHHFLQRPTPEHVVMQDRELPHLPINLPIQEQDCILKQMNERLSQCAFDFVAKYQFPIPLAPNTRPVERPTDRDWVEWVYLLKRLATKRRVPARVLYNGQIKQFVPTLEHSLEMRYVPKGQRRPLKDDRHVLQLLSAGIQVAKILKDPLAMDFLDRLYASTEAQIRERATPRYRN